jgi:hypothetical protein
MMALERPARVLFQFFLVVSVAALIIAFSVPEWFRVAVELFPIRATIFVVSWGILAACSAFVWSLSRVREARRFLESLAKGILVLTFVLVGTPVLVLPRIQIDPSGVVLDPGGKPLLDSSSLSQASAIMFCGALVALLLIGAMYVYVDLERRNSAT